MDSVENLLALPSISLSSKLFSEVICCKQQENLQIPSHEHN